jgi:hypothetical protein
MLKLCITQRSSITIMKGSESKLKRFLNTEGRICLTLKKGILTVGVTYELK